MAHPVPNPENAFTLSPEAMLDTARRQTGLDDFGPDEFMEPFRRFVAGAAEIQFNAIGHMAFAADVQRWLINRLRFEEDLRRHPEILDEDVSDPIVVLGLVRTGTTKLQRMLSADPQVRSLYFWRLLNPARFPDEEPAAPDPRIAAAHEAVNMLKQLSPGYMAAHPTIVDDADEDLVMMPMTFETLVLYMLIPSPQYYEWIKHRPLHHTYRYLARLLKYLQWQDRRRTGDTGKRPWIMKSPVHIGNLDALLEVFPNATLAHSHRDVTEVMGSFCNLVEAGLRLKMDEVDRNEIGRSMLELWQTEMDKHLQLRRQLASKLNILDVSYRQINSDPIALIRAIHQRAGRMPSEDSINAMRRWEQQNPKDLHGKNSYSLEQYGLTADVVRAAFRDYTDQFGQFTV